MRTEKHKVVVTRPWCNTGATMTGMDAEGGYCMACKRKMKRVRPMPK